MLILLWIIFITSVAGIFLLVLSHLPKAFQPTVKVRAVSEDQHFYSYVARKLRNLSRLIWHFILEAKDLRPNIKIRVPVEKVKKAFRIHIRSTDSEPVVLPEVAGLAPASQDAETVYLEAIKKDPQNKAAYENLGRLCLQEKKYEEAAEIFEYLTNFDPGHDTYFSNLGLSYYSLKKFPQAAAAYEKALNLNSKIPARWINLGLSFMATGELARAIKAVTNAVNLDKRNINYLMLLSDLYFKARNLIRAEQVLEQILETDPTNRAAREKLMKLRI